MFSHFLLFLCPVCLSHLSTTGRNLMYVSQHGHQASITHSEGVVTKLSTHCVNGVRKIPVNISIFKSSLPVHHCGHCLRIDAFPYNEKCH